MLIIALEMSHLRLTTLLNPPLNTLTESLEPVATSTIHKEIGMLTSMLSEQLDIWTNIGPSQPLSRVAYLAHLAHGALALG